MQIANATVLSQRDKENNFHPVIYYSGWLLNAEINYTNADKELLAIRDILIAWRHPLLGVKYQIIVYTNHRSLIYTLGKKVANRRQQR